MVIQMERSDLILLARVVELWKPNTDIYNQWKKDIVKHLRDTANRVPSTTGQTVN